MATAAARGDPGPPPDLSARYALKAKYARLQHTYARALEMRKDLTLEVGEKEGKVQRLQDEVDLVIDQIYDSDYAHLRPERDDLFSDEEEEGEGVGATAGGEDAGEKENGQTNGETNGGKVRKDHPTPDDSHPQAKRVRLEDGAQSTASNGATAKGSGP